MDASQQQGQTRLSEQYLRKKIFCTSFVLLVQTIFKISFFSVQQAMHALMIVYFPNLHNYSPISLGSFGLLQRNSDVGIPCVLTC